LEDDIQSSQEDRRDAIISSVNRRVQVLTQASSPIDSELLLQLLLRRRIIVIVDRLSELSAGTRSLLQPSGRDFSINALIITSRKEESLEGVPRVSFRPSRLTGGDMLYSFMREYLKQRSLSEQFTPFEFMSGCAQLARVIGKRSVTPLFARLYADYMIASKLSNEHWSERVEPVPESLPDLVVTYICSINQHRSDEDPDNAAVLADVKAIAWECMQLALKPGVASVADVLTALGKPNPKVRLDYIENRLHLIVRRAGVDGEIIRFSLDPVAEYLAAIKVAEDCSVAKMRWSEFLGRLAQISNVESIQGFLSAFEDVCSVDRMHVSLEIRNQIAELCRSGAVSNS
jgi:hypothetical protein